MKLFENEIFEKYGKRYLHGMRNTLLPYEYEWSCAACACNIIKKNNEPTKIQRKKQFLSIA